LFLFFISVSSANNNASVNATVNIVSAPAVSTCPVCYGGSTREIIYKNYTNNITQYVQVPYYINRTVVVNNITIVNNTVPVETIVYKYPDYYIVFIVAAFGIGASLVYAFITYRIRKILEQKVHDFIKKHAHDNV
jgi:hypothetical protein